MRVLLFVLLSVSLLFSSFSMTSDVDAKSSEGVLNKKFGKGTYNIVCGDALCADLAKLTLVHQQSPCPPGMKKMSSNVNELKDTGKTSVSDTIKTGMTTITNKINEKISAASTKFSSSDIKKIGSSAIQQGLIPCDPGAGLPEDKISVDTGKNEFRGDREQRDSNFVPEDPLPGSGNAGTGGGAITFGYVDCSRYPEHEDCKSKGRTYDDGFSCIGTKRQCDKAHDEWVDKGSRRGGVGTVKPVFPPQCDNRWYSNNRC